MRTPTPPWPTTPSTLWPTSRRTASWASPACSPGAFSALGLLVHLAASREALGRHGRPLLGLSPLRPGLPHRPAGLRGHRRRRQGRRGRGPAERCWPSWRPPTPPHTQDRDRLLALAELASRRLAEGRDAEAEWVRQGGGLIKAYRDENAQVRSDPPPAYFASHVEPETYRQGVAGAVPRRRPGAGGQPRQRRARRGPDQGSTPRPPPASTPPTSRRWRG